MSKLKRLEHYSQFTDMWSSFRPSYDDAMQYIESFISTDTFDEFEFAVRRDMVQEDAAPMQGLAQDGDTHDHSQLTGLKPKAKAGRKPPLHNYSCMVGQLRTRMAALRRRGQANCTRRNQRSWPNTPSSTT